MNLKKKTTNVKFDWLKDENGSLLVNSLNINMPNIYYGQLLNVQGVLSSILQYIQVINWYISLVSFRFKLSLEGF
jgi:hypothetical protein